MSELYDRIISERGSFERLVARIPGFGGYLDNKARRLADRMLRDHVSGQLALRINRLADIQKRLLDSGGLALMSEMTSAKSKLQLYHDRVKAAVPGYSGFFAAIKIGAEELEKLYSFDEAQVRYMDEIDTAIKAVDDAVTSNAGVAEAITGLDRVTTEANEVFTLREDVLTQLDKGL